MATRAGVAKTAKEAIICKSSSSLLGNDCGGLQKPRMEDGDGFKCRRQSPLLNRIYHSRNQVIHKMVASCLRTLQFHENDAVLNPQLLLLGAGVDVTFEGLYSNSTKIFAVDYPEIMLERKTALSDIRFDKDSGVSESFLESNSPSLISADLCDFDDLWMKLSRSGFNAECSTIVLIECVLCYIDSSSVQKLLKQLSNHLPPQSILITYDPMVPKPSINSTLSNLSVTRSDFAQMMADKFTERNAPILHNIKSIEMQKTFNKLCGWQYVTAMSMYTASRCVLTPEERMIPISAEPFDEFASLAMLHKLYNVTLASLSEQLFLSCLRDLKLKEGAVKRKIEAPKSIDASVDFVNNPSSAIAAVGRTSQSSLSSNADDPLGRLLQRIATAELRVQSLIFRKTSKDMITYRGLACRIRRACNLDSEAVIALYKEVICSVPDYVIILCMTTCFAEQATKYIAVRKFVKKSVKSLSASSTEFSEKQGSNFWVAEVYRDRVGESNVGVMNDNMCIVGCIGLKAATAAVDWTQPAPDSHQELTGVRAREGSDGDNKGTHSTTDTQEHRGEISHMCVSKSHRGKGLARALLDHLLHYARTTSTTSTAACYDHDRMQSGVTTNDTCTGTQSSFSSLDLTVLCDLTVARSLYLSKGFTDQGPPSDLGHGCLLQHMSLSLPSAVY